MNVVDITYKGGFVANYRSDSPMQLGFDARLGYVSVYVDGHEYSHEWDFVASIRSEGQVSLLDVYQPEVPHDHVHA